MKQYVLDANILFSALISKKEHYLDLISHDVFYTPDFAFIELNKYRSVILKKLKLRLELLNEYTFRLFRKVIVTPDYIISDNVLIEAINLCEEIDPKDTVYVALAIELDAILLTRDKILYDGLTAKGFTLVQLFDDFVRNSPIQ